jgi:hypothetical protein
MKKSPFFDRKAVVAEMKKLTREYLAIPLCDNVGCSPGCNCAKSKKLNRRLNALLSFYRECNGLWDE